MDTQFDDSLSFFRSKNGGIGVRFEAQQKSGTDVNTNNRRGEVFPDSQQVFVGNLPMDISEPWLKQFFQRKPSCQLLEMSPLCVDCKPKDFHSLLLKLGPIKNSLFWDFTYTTASY